MAMNNIAGSLGPIRILTNATTSYELRATSYEHQVTSNLPQITLVFQPAGNFKLRHADQTGPVPQAD